jgi:hypothetical protein
MTRRMVLGLIAMALLLGPAPGVAGAASSSAPKASACVVAITSLHFHPRHVAAGGSAVVRVTARNCTHQPQTVTLTWLGQFAGPQPGIPPGCPAMDPVGQRSNVKPRGTFKAKLGVQVFTSCTATSLSETARLTGTGGTVLAEQTAALRIT